MQPVSQADIARAAGVSTATVSYALRDSGDVAPATRQRIRALAASMGYVRDSRLSHLASRRFRRQQAEALEVAVLGADERLPPGLSDDVDRLGFRLHARPIHPGQDVNSLQAELHERGMRGAVVLPNIRGRDQAPLRACDWSPMAMVFLGPTTPACSYCVIHSSVYEQWLRCWREAVARGYRRIGALPHAHQPLAPDDHLRLAACAAGQQLAPDMIPIPPFLGDHRCTVEPILDWIRQHRPDCLIGFNPRVWWLLRDRDVHLPYVCIGVPSRSDRSRLCMVGDFGPDAYQLALQQLDLLLRHGHLGPLRVPYYLSCQPHWYEGDSLPQTV